MQNEYIFEGWHVPISIVVFVAGAWIYSKIWDSYKYRHYNDSYKAMLKEKQKQKKQTLT